MGKLLDGTQFVQVEVHWRASPAHQASREKGEGRRGAVYSTQYNAKCLFVLGVLWDYMLPL
jgi:hypothetical protein